MKQCQCIDEYYLNQKDHRLTPLVHRWISLNFLHIDAHSSKCLSRQAMHPVPGELAGLPCRRMGERRGRHVCLARVKGRGESAVEAGKGDRLVTCGRLSQFYFWNLARNGSKLENGCEHDVMNDNVSVVSIVETPDKQWTRIQPEH